MTIYKSLYAAAAAVCLLAISTHAAAQANTAEIAVGGGLASFRESGQSTNKGKFDASVSYNALKALSIGFEYGYTPLGSVTVSGSGFNASASGNLQNYGAVVHAGLAPSFKLQPYVLGAGGGVRANASASAVSGGITSTASQTETGGYVGVGAGLNARLGGGFGVRPEFRYQRLSISGSGLNEFDATGSLFYTFGGTHKKK